MDFWKKCSTCKKPIGFEVKYYICSVSTCNGQRTGYVFCTVACWDSHVPGANHKNAGALERKSPKKSEIQNFDSISSAQQSDGPKRIIVQSQGVQKSTNKSTSSQEVLVVVSKVKSYIKEISDFNTSDTIMQLLSDKIRSECDRAIENASKDGRKTVLDRDVK